MIEAERQAVVLLDQLEEVFDDFCGRSEASRAQKQKSKRGVAGLFRGWFTTSPTLEPEQQRFLDDARTLAIQLAEALDKLPDVERRQALAAQGVDCYLRVKTRGNETPEDWLLTAAEFLCAPILPHLSMQDLSHARDGILERTPRRLLFPKQLELVERMEALLKESKLP